jgi:hypothetical protein
VHDGVHSHGTLCHIVCAATERHVQPLSGMCHLRATRTHCVLRTGSVHSQCVLKSLLAALAISAHRKCSLRRHALQQLPNVLTLQR